MRPLAHTSSYGSINVRPLVHWGLGDQRRDVRLALALLVVLGQHRLVRLVLSRGPGPSSASPNLRWPKSFFPPVVPEFLYLSLKGFALCIVKSARSHRSFISSPLRTPQVYGPTSQIQLQFSPLQGVFGERRFVQAGLEVSLILKCI